MSEPTFYRGYQIIPEKDYITGRDICRIMNGQWLAWKRVPNEDDARTLIDMYEAALTAQADERRNNEQCFADRGTKCAVCASNIKSCTNCGLYKSRQRYKRDREMARKMVIDRQVDTTKYDVVGR